LLFEKETLARASANNKELRKDEQAMNKSVGFRRAVFTMSAVFLLALVTSGCEAEKEKSKAKESPAPIVANTKVADVDGDRIINADSEAGSWLSHGRTYDEQRFSPLDQINTDSVEKLGLAWYFDTDVDRGLEASPIVVDGVIYTTGAWSMVYALDARSGELLWKYYPKVPGMSGFEACCGVVNRGVAVWKGRVYVGTLDGRLVALNAENGKVAWEVRTTPSDKPYTITGAPRIVKGKVIIGNGGAEMGVRGYFTAYAADTGKQLWRFYTVPGNPELAFESPELEMAAKTWKGGEWWKLGGGGTAWDSMAYDPQLDLLYVGVGNGSPWVRHIRSPGGGDNLFLSSIVAVRPDTGEYVWHYQTTPGDNWDFTATQHMILADLEIKGKVRKVIMQAPKNGFFYVLDRETGEFISAENYVPTNWATHVDASTGRPVENPQIADYAEDLQLVTPAPVGGHNWHPMAFNPQTGLVYIPANEVYFPFGINSKFKLIKGWNIGVQELAGSEDLEELAMIQAGNKGRLLAWNPVTQTEAWRVEYNDPGNGGVLTTAGNLVFQGTIDGHLKAYSADTGELLWQVETNTPVMAPPVTYSVDGQQYLAVMAGWGGSISLSWGDIGKSDRPTIKYESRLQVFKLGGNATLPTPFPARAFPEPPPLVASTELVDSGRDLYHAYCGVCHGGGAAGGGTLPDLRYMSEETHQQFMGIVYGGAYQERGMIGFHEQMDMREVESIHAFIIKRAHDLKSELAQIKSHKQ